MASIAGRQNPASSSSVSPGEGAPAVGLPAEALTTGRPSLSSSALLFLILGSEVHSEKKR